MLRPPLSAGDWKYTRLEIRPHWPGDERPNEGVLRRWLERAVERGRLRKDCGGRKNNPYRYRLPAREEA